MRAVAVRRFGESALMTDLPAPGAEDSVLIRVSYAGVNPVDWQLVDQLTPNSPFPFVLGVDVAGLAEHVPAQETRLRVGDRVFGMARTHGSYAEYTAVPTGGRTEPLARIPDSVPDDRRRPGTRLPSAVRLTHGNRRMDSTRSPGCWPREQSRRASAQRYNSAMRQPCSRRSAPADYAEKQSSDCIDSIVTSRSR